MSKTILLLKNHKNKYRMQILVQKPISPKKIESKAPYQSPRPDPEKMGAL